MECQAKAAGPEQAAPVPMICHAATCDDSQPGGLIPCRRARQPLTTRTTSAKAMVGLAVALAGVPLVKADQYLSNRALAGRLATLASEHPALVRVIRLAETAQGNDVWMVELAAGAQAEQPGRPALLVVAGIEGNDLAGTASVVAWLDHLCQNQSTNLSLRELLGRVTVYAVPRLNADAAERFFARPKAELTANSRPVDDDHDGLTDEDGPEDLNDDGLITQMRVNDPEGEYVPDPAEPRLLVRADRAKGEVGAWRLLVEGRDNDGDHAWNEDGPGGVNLNRNFPYNYRFFAPDAGRHQISEPETRALADFVVNHPNIGAVFTFGAADNLVQTPKAEAPKRPPTALHDQDLPYYRELGKAWRQALGLNKELPAHAQDAPGTFSDWMYFHRGRLSLAARVWSPVLAVALAQAPTNAPGPQKPTEPEAVPSPAPPRPSPPKERPSATESSPESDKTDRRGEEERAFLKWAEGHAPELFVPWQPIEHPDFPGRRVEVGGWVPFAKTNPPEKLLPELAGRHAQFLTDLLGRLPRLEVVAKQLKDLGDGMFDLTVTVRNAGYLPTALAQGEFSRQVHPTRVTLLLEEKAILAGTRRVMLGPIPGSGGSKEVRWVFLAPGLGRVEVEAVSALGGTARTHIDLKATTQP